MAKDVQEISTTAFKAFLSTFHYNIESDSDTESDFDSDNSDSDLSDLDLDMYGCGEITSEIESRVDNTWDLCNPLEEVYGETTSQLIKETVKTATEETQCAGLNFFKDIIEGEDLNLIKTCTDISYWCCCETIKKSSPIIADACANLLI